MFGRKVREREGADMAPRGRGAKVWHRLLQSNAELESEALQEQSRQVGAVPIHDCGDRAKVTVSGTVASQTVDPSADCQALEVELRDGSGEVTLVWLGRKKIPGIETGTSVKVTGRISCRDGRKLMYNPAYELLA